MSRARLEERIEAAEMAPVTGLRAALEAAYVMAYRQLLRFARSPSRLVSSIVNPLVWLVFFGLGWANAFKMPGARSLFGGVDYLTFLVPGVIAMSVFTGSLISGISVIFDKQFGFLKEVLVAPAPRWAIILGRMLGDSATVTLQAAILALLAVPLASVRLAGLPGAIAAGYLAALGFSAMGVVLASRITSHEGFQMIMSFLMMPLVFLSGAFYPIDTMPGWMKALAYINPLTYAVDLMRYLLTSVHSFAPATSLGALLALDTVLVAAAAAVFEKMTIA